jgi:hypothetical protein
VRRAPTRTNPRNRCLSSAELNVRIHSAPAKSLLRTGFATQRRKADDHLARPRPVQARRQSERRHAASARGELVSDQSRRPPNDDRVAARDRGNLSGSLLTLRWREMDSNSQFPVFKC